MKIDNRLRLYIIGTACAVLLTARFNDAGAQEFPSRQYTIENGLAGSVVYQVIQDRDGYLWFATTHGVSRFDGKTFTRFTRENGLPDNEIIKLYLDRHNNIWFLTFSGVPAVYCKGQIISFSQCIGVYAVVEDLVKDSLLLLRSPHRDTSNMYGCYRSLNRNGNWNFERHFEFKGEGAVNPDRWFMLRASSPEKINYYFGVKDLKTNFLKIRSPGTDTQYNYQRRPPSDIPTNDIRHFFTLSKNKNAIVFSSFDTLYYADTKKLIAIAGLRDPQLAIRGPFNINYLFYENDSTLWICTRDRGLLMIGNFLSPEKRYNQYLAGSFCTSILKDHENGYWITTYNNGVYYLPNLQFRYISGEKELISKEARCIRALPDGQLAAGFANGNILQINPGDMTTRSYSAWVVNRAHVRVLGIEPWQKDQIIVASDAGPFLVSPTSSGKKLGILMATKAVYVTPRRTIAVAAAGGTTEIPGISEKENDIYPVRATCVTGIDDQLYWGTQDGVFKLSGDSIEDLKKRFPPLSGIINGITATPESGLWVATQDGIAILKNDSAYVIKKEQGLLSNFSRHITINGSTAWVSSDLGISRIVFAWNNDRLKYAISGITESDGLTSNDVNQTAFSRGYIWAATTRGIVYFPASYISGTVQAPLMNISAIYSGDQIRTGADTISVDRNHNRLFIELSGISYQSGKELSYEYRIGPDPEWTHITNNTIEMTALPFGTYLFEARAIDRWGKRSSESKKIVILNSPPFWKTTWFTVISYALLGLVIGAAFLWINRYQHKKRDAGFRLKKKMHDLEIMALRSQINPHFIFNCLSSIQYHIQNADIENSNRYLYKFSLLIRKILKNSTQSLIPLNEEKEILELYLELEKLRLGNRMEYRLRVDETLQNDSYYIHSMIIQPYLENAIKHGIAPLQDRQGMVTVEFKRSEKYIECFIEDDGIGIKKSVANQASYKAGHTSMGAGITESRIDAINAISNDKIKIQVTDKGLITAGASTGTLVQLSFPIIID